MAPDWVILFFFFFFRLFFFLQYPGPVSIRRLLRFLLLRSRYEIDNECAGNMSTATGATEGDGWPKEAPEERKF